MAIENRSVDGERVKRYSRPGNDLTRRFPLIVGALARLRSRSCIIDGEAVACDDTGIAASSQLMRGSVSCGAGVAAQFDSALTTLG